MAGPTARDQKILDDKQKIENDGYWIYSDIPKAFAEAKASGKPIVVVLRCIPCIECVQLDDNMVTNDPRLRPLLDKFVRVRVVSTNGLDLAQFQCDTDQSFAVFLLNADGTVYGRFGTRSHKRNWVGDVSIDGMAKALAGALELHAEYPLTKAILAGKRGPTPEFATPEKFPTLRNEFTNKIQYEGNVARSCIHCHQIGDARKAYYRQKAEPMPEDVLFPYPHPKSLGLVLDPKERATVTSVAAGSLAEAAGFRAGDAIRSMNGQPLLSMADVQWVLHRTPATGGSITAIVGRNGNIETMTLNLPNGWRRNDDISWRASSWGLRRMATGGMVLEQLPIEERKEGLPLRVRFVGSFGPNVAAKNAGVEIGDLIQSWDGKTDFTRETDVLAHGVLTHKPGDKIPVKLLRAGKTIEVTIPMQD